MIWLSHLSGNWRHGYFCLNIILDRLYCFANKSFQFSRLSVAHFFQMTVAAGTSIENNIQRTISCPNVCSIYLRFLSDLNAKFHIVNLLFAIYKPMLISEILSVILQVRGHSWFWITIKEFYLSFDGSPSSIYGSILTCWSGLLTSWLRLLSFGIKEFRTYRLCLLLDWAWIHKLEGISIFSI